MIVIIIAAAATATAGGSGGGRLLFLEQSIFQLHSNAIAPVIAHDH